MILSLSEDCPLFSRANRIHLDRLLHTVYSRQNLIANPSPQRLRDLLTPESWEVYGDLIGQAYKRVLNSRHSLNRHADCASCSPKQLADYYALPTIIVVENASTDGGWIALVARLLNADVHSALVGAAGNTAIYNGGGIGEIPRQLDEIVERRRTSTMGPGYPSKIVAVSDSDADHPDDIPAAARRVQQAADRNGVRAHLLRKRTIENYIPDSALSSYSQKRAHCKPAVRRLESLTRVQRDFYPMKTGLKAGDAASTAGLFNLEHEDAIGMGDFIADFLRDFSFQVEEHELRSRDGRQELDELLHLIEENL